MAEWSYEPPSDEDIATGGTALLEYVGATADDAEYAGEKWAEAHALVHQHVAGATVPGHVLDQAILEVGSKLWARRRTQGDTGFGDGFEAAPIMAARDPLVTVYATLGPFLPGAFA